MSRIGRMPIILSSDVTIKIDGCTIVVKGPKGELRRVINKDMTLVIEDRILTINRPSDNKEHRSLHGLTRTLINNMVIGVVYGFKKTLEINGVGYRASKTNNRINLSLGFSHPIEIEPPADIVFDIPSPNKIVISGINKETVGAVAAKIRSFREPDPYKGKGIKYEGEIIRRKAGKAGGKGKK